MNKKFLAACFSIIVIGSFFLAVRYFQPEQPAFEITDTIDTVSVETNSNSSAEQKAESTATTTEWITRESFKIERVYAPAYVLPETVSDSGSEYLNWEAESAAHDEEVFVRSWARTSSDYYTTNSVKTLQMWFQIETVSPGTFTYYPAAIAINSSGNSISASDTTINTNINDTNIDRNGRTTFWCHVDFDRDTIEATVEVWDYNAQAYTQIFNKVGNPYSTDLADVKYARIQLLTLKYQPDSVIEHRRIDSRYISGTIERKLELSVNEWNSEIRIYTDYDISHVDGDCAYNYESGSGYWKINETLGYIDYVFYFSEQENPKYLAIKESNEYLENEGFENGYSNDWLNDSSAGFTSFALNSTIVSSEGAFSLRLSDSDASSDYFYNTIVDNANPDLTGLPSGDYYLSFDYFIETLTAGTLNFEYANDASLVSKAFLDTTTGRWHRAFFFIQPRSGTYQFIRLLFGSFQGTVFIDNWKYFTSSIQAYTNSAGTNTFTATVRSWDGYSNPVAANTQCNLTLVTRADNSSVQSFIDDTDASGIFTATYTGTLSAQEYTLMLDPDANTFTGDGGSQKTFFTPMTASYIDFFETKGNAIDFTAETAESLTPTAGGSTIDINNATKGFWHLSASTDAAREIYTSFSTSFDSSYYNTIIARVKYTSAAARTVRFYDATHGVFYYLSGYANVTEGFWQTVTINIPNVGAINSYRFYFDDAYPCSSTILAADNYYIDDIKLVHVDTPNLREYDSYFYLSSENDTLKYKIYQDQSFYGIVNDLSVFQKNRSTGIHNVTFVVNQDLDEQRCYLPSSSYYYAYTISADAFKVSVESVDPSDTYMSVYCTANYDYSYTVYENDSSTATGSGSAEGTSIIWTKDTTAGALINYAIKFVYSSETLWFNSSYSIAASTTFRIDYEFLEVGDWQAHYTIETNMDRDSVSIYLFLNDSAVEFPDGSYTTLPGSIIFSRPSYGYYNFTRIAEYDGSNYTRDTWITITSNALVTNFLVSGLESSSDRVAISWNTNKGTGILYAYDNSSLVATDSSEGSLVITKSSTVGLHQLSFDVVVESKNVSFTADYTVSDWTVSVAVTVYDSTSYYVSVDKLHDATVTVTRSDDADFDGYVFINGTTVTVTGGTGSFSLSSSDVERDVYTVTHVQDLTSTNRTFSANDLTVTFDKLVGYLSLVGTTETSASFVVAFNNSYDDEIVNNFEYAVYVNEQYHALYTSNTFTIENLSPGTYTVTLKKIRNQDNAVDTGTSTTVTLEIKGKQDALANTGGWAILLILAMLGAAIGWRWYRKNGEGKTWAGVQKGLASQSEKLNRRI